MEVHLGFKLDETECVDLIAELVICVVRIEDLEKEEKQFVITVECVMQLEMMSFTCNYSMSCTHRK